MKNLDCYLKAGANLNFWMSEEFIRMSEWVWVVEGDLSGWKEKLESKYWMVPPLRNERIVWEVPYWAGFSNQDNKQFLDYEFIYDPQSFLNLSGNRWKVFRRNIRQIEKTGEFVYRKILPEENVGEWLDILLAWADGKEVYDPEVIVRYVLEGENRWGLWRDGGLVGFNIADMNQQNINYRFAFNIPEDKLNEYLRWCFYTHPDILETGKKVNDGGCLESDGLFRFKMKLNPIAVNKISTNIPCEQEGEKNEF